MKKPMLIALAVCLILGVGTYSLLKYRQTAAKQALLNQQQQMYARLVEMVDDLHTNLNTLSPSVDGHDALMEQLRKMKEWSTAASAKVQRLAVDVHSLPSGPNSLLLQEAAEKTQKYADGYALWSNQNIDADTQNAKAETMLNELGQLRQAINAFGSPDKGDTSAAIKRVEKLVKQFKESSEVPAVTGGLVAQMPSAPSGGTVNYWANPTYDPYHDAIKSIVVRYDGGRRVLAKVLDQFDRGALSDLSEWNNQLTLRRGLIQELDNLSVPPLTIYQQHHDELYNMLENGCVVMENFARHPNPQTRQAIKNISAGNTLTMRRLRAFYSIN